MNLKFKYFHKPLYCSMAQRLRETSCFENIYFGHTPGQTKIPIRSIFILRLTTVK